MVLLIPSENAYDLRLVIIVIISCCHINKNSKWQFQKCFKIRILLETIDNRLNAIIIRYKYHKNRIKTTIDNLYHMVQHHKFHNGLVKN